MISPVIFFLVHGLYDIGNVVFLILLQDSDASHEGRQKCSSQAGRIRNGAKHTTEGLEGVISNGSFKESNPQTTTEICQRVFFDVIISEKFTSLCKILFDNFQGIRLDSLFHLNLINSRMKDGVYEHSPMLFLSDIQQVIYATISICMHCLNGLSLKLKMLH